MPWVPTVVTNSFSILINFPASLTWWIPAMSLVTYTTCTFTLISTFNSGINLRLWNSRVSWLKWKAITQPLRLTEGFLCTLGWSEELVVEAWYSDREAACKKAGLDLNSEVMVVGSGVQSSPLPVRTANDISEVRAEGGRREGGSFTIPFLH